jgi:hypothetical protein
MLVELLTRGANAAPRRAAGHGGREARRAAVSRAESDDYAVFVSMFPTRLVAAGWDRTARDGVWVPAGRPAGGAPAVLVTTLHHLGQPVGIAWMNASHLRFALYAGTSQPSGSWPNDGSVPRPLWGSLVAAMNSGFRLKQSMGGWYLDGAAAVPLINGAASFVVFRDGSATVGEWGRDVALGPSVVAVRQNLTMLLEGGAPTPAVATAKPQVVWGPPYHGNILTWRSAIGVSATGNLLYVAGPAMDPETLAAAMVIAGARRAMELDINPLWDNFDTYTGNGATVRGEKLLPNMSFAPNHFLVPFWRDFIAVFVRTN